MAITPSPIYQASSGNTDRLYYAPQGSTQLQQIADPTQLQGLAKQGLVQVGTQYQQYDPSSGLTLPGATPAATPAPAPSPTPATNTEVKPGVFSAGSLLDFYGNMIKNLQPQAEQAQQQLATSTSELQKLQIPDFGALYNEKAQANIAPLDEQIKGVGTQVATIDNALRNLETDVRNEIGGRAAESIIQAEISRRAQPLIRERQAFVDQSQLLAGQKQSAIDSITREINFNQQNFDNQIKQLEFRNNLASDTVNAFTKLMEQGAQASQDAQDRATKLFTGFLEQSPDFLNKLSEAEIQSLQNGSVPFSVMQKLGDTVKKQQEVIANLPKDAELRTIDGNLYSVRQLANGTYETQLVIGKAKSGGGGGVTTSGVDPSLERAAVNAYYDEFQKFPTKTDLKNVVARYVLKATQYRPTVSPTLGDINGAPIFGPGVPDYSSFRPFESTFKELTTGNTSSLDSTFNSL